MKRKISTWSKPPELEAYEAAVAQKAAAAELKKKQETQPVLDDAQVLIAHLSKQQGATLNRMCVHTCGETSM